MQESESVSRTQPEDSRRRDRIRGRGVDAAGRQRFQVVRPVDVDVPQDDARVRQIEDVEHAFQRMLPERKRLRQAQVEQSHPVVPPRLTFDDDISQLIQRVRHLHDAREVLALLRGVGRSDENFPWQFIRAAHPRALINLRLRRSEDRAQHTVS